MSDFVEDSSKVLFGHSWSVSAPAKINLRLKVLGRRGDGYHILSMLNASVSLCDEATLRFDNASASTVQCVGLESTKVATADNLIFRAYELFWKVCGFTSIPFSLQAVVDKHIPVGGGLGGGSSDAATLLRFLIQKLGPLLEQHGVIDQSGLEEKLLNASQTLGADVPYALRRGVCWVKGVGECVTSLTIPHLEKLVLLLTVPRDSVPTVGFYDFYRRNKSLPEGELVPDREMEIVHSGRTVALDSLFVNDFEPYIRQFRPQVGEQLDVAREFFPLTSFTGSGSVYFSVVSHESEQRISEYRRAIEKFGAGLRIVKVI
jgi:4-diphosphocytidyl-2-C-methyl-D-erythritol kinase